MAITKIEHLINGQVVAEQTTAPFTSFSSTHAASIAGVGTHTISARMYEDGVLTHTTATRSFTVTAVDDGGGGTTDPEPDPTFSVEGLSPETLWHKFDAATTSDTPTNGFDSTVWATDSLTTTPHDLHALAGTVSQAVENGKECLALGGTLRTDSKTWPVFAESFSLHFEIKMTALPASPTDVITIDTGSEFYVQIRDSGVIGVGYKTSSNVFLTPPTSDQSLTAAMTDFVPVDIIITKNGSIREFINNIEQPLSSNSALQGDMTNNAMDFSGSGNLIFGGALDGFIRNVIIQPVVYTEADRTNLAAL